MYPGSKLELSKDLSEVVRGWKRMGEEESFELSFGVELLFAMNYFGVDRETHSQIVQAFARVLLRFIDAPGRNKHRKASEELEKLPVEWIEEILDPKNFNSRYFPRLARCQGKLQRVAFSRQEIFIEVQSDLVAAIDWIELGVMCSKFPATFKVHLGCQNSDFSETIHALNQEYRRVIFDIVETEPKNLTIRNEGLAFKPLKFFDGVFLKERFVPTTIELVFKHKTFRITASNWVSGKQHTIELSETDEKMCTDIMRLCLRPSIEKIVLRNCPSEANSSPKEFILHLINLYFEFREFDCPQQGIPRFVVEAEVIKDARLKDFWKYCAAV
jgi:hypothetical protein